MPTADASVPETKRVALPSGRTGAPKENKGDQGEDAEGAVAAVTSIRLSAWKPSRAKSVSELPSVS